MLFNSIFAFDRTPDDHSNRSARGCPPPPPIQHPLPNLNSVLNSSRGNSNNDSNLDDASSCSHQFIVDPGPATSSASDAHANQGGLSNGRPPISFVYQRDQVDSRQTLYSNLISLTNEMKYPLQSKMQQSQQSTLDNNNDANDKSESNNNNNNNNNNSKSRRRQSMLDRYIIILKKNFYLRH